MKELFKFIWMAISKYFLTRNKGIVVNGKILLMGIPTIRIKNGGQLIIGDNVSLYSIKRMAHLSMHSPVLLIADKPGAKIYVGNNTRIHGSCIHAWKSCRIGNNCIIAVNCQIFDCSGHDLSFHNVGNRINTRGVAKRVVIEDNVWIGANSIILPGVIIGNGAVIAAGSVVINDIPPMCLAGGNPAVVIKNYSNI
jgi:acetyltransferase-like isoleucine patch superfamily enzyme